MNVAKTSSFLLKRIRSAQGLEPSSPLKQSTLLGATAAPTDQPRVALWPIALGLLLGGAAGVDTAKQESRREGSVQLPQHPAQQKGWHLLDAPTRRRTFYKYERRIRDFSQPDKVFHYFSSRTQPDGSRVMTPMDLVRAVLAVYPPEASADSRSGGLAGEPSRSSVTGRRSINAPHVQGSKFLQAFDADKDGISFSEYLLLLTFLKIPAQDVKIVFKMFDLDDDGTITPQEFEEITGALQQRLRKGLAAGSTRALAWRRADSSRSLKNYLLGPDRKKSLSLKEFADFIEGLHEELLRLEFEHYDIDGDEAISGVDFARSILSSVDLSTIDSYLDRAASLPPQLASMKVTYEQFRHFAQLHQHIHSLAVALEFFLNIGGKLERPDFRRATKIVTGTEISDELVEIVFQLFDTNRDGNLSPQELIAVLRRREGSHNDRSSDDSGNRQTMFACFYACAFER